MKIILTGGSGFIGLYLAKYFVEKGHEVIIVSRHAPTNLYGAKHITWDDPSMQMRWCFHPFEQADIVFNLAGKSVNCRYTPENKAEILKSRIDTTKMVGEIISSCKNRPKLWLNSSSATIYKDTRGDLPANDDVNGITGDDFSMGVCKAWEKAFFECPTPPDVRKCALRMTIVLGREGGALPIMMRLAKFGLGGPQGPGNQWFSWLHIEDLARMVEFIDEHPELSGPINCAAPNPVTNRELMRELRKTVGMPFGLPATTWMLKLGAIFLGTETELILKSRKVVPKKLLDAGFQFKIPFLKLKVKS